MDGETLKSRLTALLQKSRKAVRLYSGYEKSGEGEPAAYTGLQLEQWQSINTDLQRQVTAMLDRPHTRLLGSETVGLRDRFYGMWRAFEAELREKQIELSEVAVRGDFVRAAILSRAAVILKAREQAAQAAHHELQLVVEKFRLGISLPSQDQMDARRSVDTRNDTVEHILAGPITLADQPIDLQAAVPTRSPERPLAKVIQLKRASR